jgi:hypothetical protein
MVRGVLQTRGGAWSQAPCPKPWLQSGTPPRTDSDQKSTFLGRGLAVYVSEGRGRCPRQSRKQRRPASPDQRGPTASGPINGARPSLRCFRRMRPAAIGEPGRSMSP